MTNREKNVSNDYLDCSLVLRETMKWCGRRIKLPWVDGPNVEYVVIGTTCKVFAVWRPFQTTNFLRVAAQRPDKVLSNTNIVMMYKTRPTSTEDKRKIFDDKIMFVVEYWQNFGIKWRGFSPSPILWWAYCYNFLPPLLFISYQWKQPYIGTPC